MEEAGATSSHSPAAYPLIAAGEVTSIGFPRFLVNGIFRITMAISAAHIASTALPQDSMVQLPVFSKIVAASSQGK